MTRAEDRVTAALLEQVDLPDHAAADIDDLLDQLAAVLANRAECAVAAIALVGALRARDVTFEVIRHRTGLPAGRAHRWHRLFSAKQAKTKGAT